MTADPIPDLVLERYRLNELRPADAARIAGEISRDPGSARTASLRWIGRTTSSTHISSAVRTRLTAPMACSVRLEAGPPQTFVGSALRRTYIPAAVRDWRRARSWCLADARAVRSCRRSPETGTDRIKGTAASGRPALALIAVRTTAASSSPTAPLPHAGDLVRVGYRSAGPHLRRDRIDRRRRRRHDAPAPPAERGPPR
jgi:hypothetical protein